MSTVVYAGDRAARALVELLEQRARARPFGGARIYLSRDGERLLDVAVGEARPGVPMDLDSVLHWSCAVKPLLAVVVMRLVESGTVALTDPVHRHLPPFAEGGKQDVTIDHVLTHAGGFRQLTGPGPYLESYDSLVRRTLGAPLESGWRPGIDQGYHRETGWYALAALVEAKLGVPYPQAVADLVTEPLGLGSTWPRMTADTYRHLHRRLVVPSYLVHGAVRRVPFLVSATACQTRCPPYGGYGTIGDLAAFYEAAVGALRDARPFPLGRDCLTAMTGPVRGPAPDRTWDREYEYTRGFYRGLFRQWGHGRHWSATSFGLAGLVGQMVAGADPETGVVLAASYGTLVSDGQEMADLTETLYELAMRR